MRKKNSTVNIAVVMGGKSSERVVSLSTGQQCSLALKDLGYTVTEIDASIDIVQSLSRLNPDVIFNALHGQFGEDGIIQGCFEWLGIPYTHSGVLASALAMNKQKAREIFQLNRLPIANGFITDSKSLLQGHPMRVPYVIKPNNEGSSCGIYFVHEAANGPPQLGDDLPSQVMVEQYVKGRELTTTVMGDRALGVTEIITNGWYDYDAKYSAGGSRHEVPAALPDEITEACLDYALRAHDVLGCRGVSRTDFRWDDNQGLDGLFLLETNTQPGMTPTSLSPEQAQVQGISFGALCRWIVEDASCQR